MPIIVVGIFLSKNISSGGMKPLWWICDFVGKDEECICSRNLHQQDFVLDFVQLTCLFDVWLTEEVSVCSFLFFGIDGHV